MFGRNAGTGGEPSAGAGGVEREPASSGGGAGEREPRNTCFDGDQGGTETDEDCGGSCDPCDPGLACKVPRDCASGVCRRGTCQEPSCEDDVQNGVEADVDCGGPCPKKCTDDQRCWGNTDCESGVCVGNWCQQPACEDGTQNGTETGEDCGGPVENGCPRCGLAASCIEHTDCAAEYLCLGGECAQKPCENGATDPGEIDEDCGGDCGPCKNGQVCSESAGCSSGYCGPGGICADPTCKDLQQNQDETDLDCGGLRCPPCFAGRSCVADMDCASGDCSRAVCRSVEVRYRVVQKETPSAEIAFAFQVVNETRSELDLSTVAVRYFYTADGGDEPLFQCDAPYPCTNLTAGFESFGNLSPAVSAAVLTFGAGTLAPSGGETPEYQVRWLRNDVGGIYNQANDYSFSSGQDESPPEPWNHMAAYVDGQLQWGTEPPPANP